MLKKALALGVEQSSVAKGSSSRGESMAFRVLFEQVERDIPHSNVVLITSFPRGGLQLAQRKRGHEVYARAYLKEFHAKDALTWAAIAENQTVSIKHPSLREVVEEGLTFREFLQNNDLRHAIAAPLTGPILQGYPGAVHVYRNDGDFTPAEMKRLDDIAADADLAIVEQRAQRKSGCAPTVWLSPRPAARIFIYDGRLRTIGHDAEEPLDQRLVEALSELGRDGLSSKGAPRGHSERILVKDQHGELTPFRMVRSPKLAGLYVGQCDGDCVLFCVQPECCDWSKLRATDVQADHEVSRLVGALHFMLEEYHRSPTLDEIAKAVHLSPFHFHRRFTELFGLTPKHLLLDCQMNQSKHELIAREKDLVKVATDCGFAHQSHFTSRFKQATGLTPTRWRRIALGAT